MVLGQAAGVAWLMGCLVAGYAYSVVKPDERPKSSDDKEDKKVT